MSMSRFPFSRTACPSCDQVVDTSRVGEGQRALCPRCGHLITMHVPNALSRMTALGAGAAIFLMLANAFPFLELEASGAEQVMTLPQAGVELYREGSLLISALVMGPILGIPALLLTILLGLLVALQRRRPSRWLVPAGRLVSFLGPWSMAEVFLFGVLVSLVKIGSMANVVLGVSFWSYVAFVLTFTTMVSSLDRLQIWEEIEACSP